MKTALLMMSAMIALSVSSCDKDDDNDLTQTDRDFMNRATYINLGEVSAGNIAQQQGTNTPIKTYGTMMVTDHNSAQQKLQSVASDADYTLPGDTDQEHKAMAQMLMGLSGDAFDSTYIYKMVEGHDKAITLFQQEMLNGGANAVRQYAEDMLPALQHHRMMADSIAHMLYP